MNATAQTAVSLNRKPPSDFNDVAREAGPELVKQRIESALHAAPAEGMASTVERTGDDAGKKKERGRKQRRQKIGESYRVDAAGVWRHPLGDDGEPLPPQWLSAPLLVEAKTRDANNEEWGRLLAWGDADGKQHRWAAPMHLMVGEGRDLARELAGRGLEIAPGSKAIQHLQNYVITEPVEARARCVPVPGWHGAQYVLPTGEAIGESSEHVVYQHSGGVAVYYASAGDWKTHIAAQCVGNSRLVLAVAAMFAGPLLRMAGIEGGGFHFVGDSSTGKSTLLKVAASVAGPPKYARKWHNTGASLESLATLHNDASLILDEIAQVDPTIVGEAVYMLANGSGKGRANRNADARHVSEWLNQTISAGEVNLAQHMAQAGKKTRAGQLVRLADIQADAGAGHGAFEQLHGAEKGATYAVRLGLLCAEHYGTAWRPWLQYLTNRTAQALPAHLKNQITAFQNDCVPNKADGQVSRVAARFGLAAVAGELATMAGLTGWPAGESRRAAMRCFRDWLEMRGGAENGEHITLLEQVRAFFEAHGGSRFIQCHIKNPPPVNNRAGFTRPDALGGTEYLVLAQTFTNELCKGYAPRSAIKWLVAAGWLRPASAGRISHSIRIPAMGAVARVYVLSVDAVHAGFAGTDTFTTEAETLHPTTKGT